MRLKSLFVGGLSLLMLGLFPAVVWASEEVRRVEMTVSAVKQYYRDRDYVSLFDILVFAGGMETNISRPAEIYFANHVHHFSQWEYLEPIFSKVGKIHLKRPVPGTPSQFKHPPKKSQVVLSAGGAIFHSLGLRDEEVEKRLSEKLSKTRLMFPLTPDYENHFSKLVGVLIGVQRAEKEFAKNTFSSNERWFSCSLVKHGHASDGTFSLLESRPHYSLTSIWMFGERLPPPRIIKRCTLQGFLSVVGLRGIPHLGLAELHVASNGAAVIGSELQCALDLLYHPQIIDGMSRTEALAVLSKYKNEGISCE